MRDFAKNVNKSSPPSSNKQQSRANKTKNTEKGAYQGRKIILSIVLLVLIILFLVSFFHSNDNENKPTTSKTSISVPVTTDKALNVTPKNLPSTANDSTQSHKNVTAPANANSTEISVESKSNIDATDKEVKEQTKPLTFSFYDTLTKKTVNVDVEPKPIKQYRYTYMLQIGSFRKKEDANATRAKLILAGLTPTVQKIGEWYRVDVGPVYSKRDGDIIKHKVEAAGISGSILRQVDKQEIKQNTADNKTTNKVQ
ncbi:SPOR domain-containing protein [Fangia hongkongensis]|uniref:SPOR domain-containing protein n=1 Tax=Fangia hongkongensis TaxID=270495 RepID=UPI00037A09EF|nr:SPOR domain-containing protein [Fangia hongkongensis]MBK2126159.1 SPOR domain-containing protein [Fangia hongkongensis]